MFTLSTTSGEIAFAGSTESSAPASGLRLPAALSDNMVLQADKPFKIWGWAVPGQTVSVKLAAQEKSATADSAGKWSVMFEPIAGTARSGTDAVDMTVLATGAGAAESRIRVRNILIGEVWLCSGQSNMQWPLAETSNAAAEIQSASHPRMRLFITRLHAPEHPADDCQGQWVECNPQTVGRFSGTAYYFGRRLLQDLQVPVGLIQSAQGATAADSWISLEGLSAQPALEPILKSYHASVKDPMGWNPHLPTGLYNGEIHPFTHFAMRGIIWYQGETNTKRAYQYRTLFPALIRSWRAARGEELPFYFVQLTSFGKPPNAPVAEALSELREAQAMALALPSTGMAVTIDVGEADNIHPKNKLEVGKRLALLALARTYGRDVACSSPLYKSMSLHGVAIRVEFTGTGSGLEARGGPLKQFSIAGEDKKFVWADAVVDGTSVVVSNPQVPRPVAVRYAWAANPAGCNLYNREGLPASPFRTDTWPGVTETAHLPRPGDQFITPPAIRPRSYPDPSAKLTGNTLSIVLGRGLPRPWEQVITDAYVYLPQVKVSTVYTPRRTSVSETRIWLPYGNTRGQYYHVTGFALTDLEPGNPAALVFPAENDRDGKPAEFVLRFHFDKPISAFRLENGPPLEFSSSDAVALIEYSTDSREWKLLSDTTGGTDAGKLFQPARTCAADLDAQDLYLRLSLRDKSDPGKLTPGASFRMRMSGDPGWGDASTT
ncbi:MAG: sialate O-acetylesterase, partial [Candidatus Methylacidiphilales bacterium]|nr:sialate O-acetylesterase [Candidatus Methylacidiphilales bacterium]